MEGTPGGHKNVNKFCSLGLRTKRPRQNGEGRDGPKLRRPTQFASTVYSDIPSAHAARIVFVQYCNATLTLLFILFSHFVLQFNTKKSRTHTFHNHASYFLCSLYFFLVLMIVKFTRNIVVRKPSALKQIPLHTQLDLILEKKKKKHSEGWKKVKVRRKKVRPKTPGPVYETR